MLKPLFSFLLFCLYAFPTYSQVYDGYMMDSSIVRFNGATPSAFVGDTSAIPLWQVGHTYKSFFSTTTTGSAAIMTDTANYYPPNANNSFIIKIHNNGNLIVDFWHKFQTDSTHAGGIVEFSTDTGLTWQNIKGDCNSDSSFGMPGVRTEGFYTFADTLFTGEPAFTGQSIGTQYSRLQFFLGFPVKWVSPTSSCSFYADTIFLRFRFLSDTTVDTLAGWMIDSIKIEHDFYPGSVVSIGKQGSLQIFPNPSPGGSFTFPALLNEQEYYIEIYNTIGAKVLSLPYTRTVHLDQYPSGLYLYKVSNGAEYYSGQLLKE